jgi:site-specific recombinase XerD
VICPRPCRRVRPRASYRFLEFFTAKIRNAHTRRAYTRAATEFFDWLAAKGVSQLGDIESIHVATYIEELSRERSAPTIWRGISTQGTGSNVSDDRSRPFDLG